MITREYKDVDGIKVFDWDVDNEHPDYNVVGLENLYEQEEKHFWFIARKEYILNNFLKFINKDSNILEIGAGTGNVSRFLIRNGYKNVSVGEMHQSGLKYALSYGIEDAYQFDLLRSPFREKFDTICMFDVLEHIENDLLALQKVNTSLKMGGSVALTVPSHMWLWNDQDRIAGHKIRYTKDQLIKKLAESGFEIVTARYFFTFITPLLLLRRVLNKDKKETNVTAKAVLEHDMSMNKGLSYMLLILSRFENMISRFIPNLFGGSLFVIATKLKSLDS